MSQTVEQALAEMQLELEHPQVAPTESTEAQTSEIVPAQEVPAVKEFSAESKLKIFSDINEYLGNLSETLSQIDNRFKSEAQAFYDRADKLANKRNIKEEDLTQICTEVLSGFIVQGCGSAISFVKTSVALSNVKAILKQEAEHKLPYLEPLINDSWGIVTVAYDRFLAHYNEDSFYLKEVAEHFNDLKLSLYHYYLAFYAQNIYINALNGTLANTIKMPTLYDVNRLLYFEMKKSDPFADNDFSYDTLMSLSLDLDSARKVIGEDLNEIINNLEEVQNISIPATVLAYDPQMMALAINEVNPTPQSFESTPFTNEDEALPASNDIYDPFVNVMGISYDYYKTSVFAEIVNDNPSLDTVVNHWAAMIRNNEEYKKVDNLLGIVMLMLGVTGCMIGISYSLAWYWCAACAFAGLLVAYAIVPVTKMKTKFRKKAHCIERAIQEEASFNAGYLEHVPLNEMASSNRKGWLYGIIGACIGAIAGPIGIIVGIIIGLALADNSSKFEKFDTDYSKIEIKWRFKWITILVLLIVCNLLMAYAKWFNS